MKGIIEELGRIKAAKAESKNQKVKPRGGQLLFDGSEYLTVSQIAKKHDLTRGLIYHRHRDLGLTGAALVSAAPVKKKGREKSVRVIIDGAEKTIEDIARICGVNPGSVYRWIRDGVDIQSKLRAAA